MVFGFGLVVVCAGCWLIIVAVFGWFAGLVLVACFCCFGGLFVAVFVVWFGCVYGFRLFVLRDSYCCFGYYCYCVLFIAICSVSVCAARLLC